MTVCRRQGPVCCLSSVSPVVDGVRGYPYSCGATGKVYDTSDSCPSPGPLLQSGCGDWSFWAGDRSRTVIPSWGPDPGLERGVEVGLSGRVPMGVVSGHVGGWASHVCRRCTGRDSVIRGGWTCGFRELSRCKGEDEILHE